MYIYLGSALWVAELSYVSDSVTPLPLNQALGLALQCDPL